MLMRTSKITQRPVVSIAGEDVAQFDAETGGVTAPHLDQHIEGLGLRGLGSYAGVIHAARPDPDLM